MADKKKKTFVESQPKGLLKGTFFDFIPDIAQVSDYLLGESGKTISDADRARLKGSKGKKTKKGTVRAFSSGGRAAIQGTEFKGTF